ncbi:MAG: hypothetical protein JSV26_02815 [bacterium]|nr:MAG: hypothetical protein JSV26_02815 [bacterium]
MSGGLERARLGGGKAFLLGVLTAAAVLVLLGAGPSGNGGPSYQVTSSTTGAGRVVVHIVDTSTGETKVVSNGIRSQYGVTFGEMAADL